MMTREEAIEELKSMLAYYGFSSKEAEALTVAITSIRHQIWEDQLWHNAKTDPPKTPGLYYGKKDDTTSMYACRYRDGVWVLDMYPQQEMDIVQWADYTEFARENEETALRPVSREQVEKVWRGEWKHYLPPLGAGNIQCRCTKCGITPDVETPFCAWCGAPMTDEAVDMVMERINKLEGMKNELG